MLRAVLDTNVLVSALIRPAGAPGQILSELIEKRSFVLVLSPALLLELRGCMEYPKVRKYVRAGKQALDRWVTSLQLVADLVEPTVLVRVVPEDPDDDRLLSAAIEGRAAYVVSGDGDVLRVKEYEGIRIIPPAAFLALLRSG